MGWIDWIALALIAGGQVYLARRMKNIETQQVFIKNHLNSFRARVGAVKTGQMSRPYPVIDSAARTVRRDSDDLPITGRQSAGVKRVRSNGRGSIDDS